MAPLLLEPIRAPRVDDPHGSTAAKNGAANEGLGLARPHKSRRLHPIEHRIYARHRRCFGTDRIDTRIGAAAFRELHDPVVDIDLHEIEALRRRVRRVSHDYDIPYIAGYSVDGKTIFIDRHLPRTIRWLLKTVWVERGFFYIPPRHKKGPPSGRRMMPASSVAK
jgi:hypothetical protein